jgi:hypothetical protein
MGGDLALRENDMHSNDVSALFDLLTPERVIAFRHQAEELAANDKDEIRQAGICWTAALGALAKLLAEPAADGEKLSRQFVGLLAAGADSLLSGLGRELQNLEVHHGGLARDMASAVILLRNELRGTSAGARLPELLARITQASETLLAGGLQ